MWPAAATITTRSRASCIGAKSQVTMPMTLTHSQMWWPSWKTSLRAMACAACAWRGSAANLCCNSSSSTSWQRCTRAACSCSRSTRTCRFLTAQVLANIASFGFKPEMKISFNGLGFQDWMRGCEGAEQDALRAIKLCVDAGFPMRVQMNINRKNRDSILPSLALLDDMGVGCARVIPTTPSTRWEMNAQGQSMEWGRKTAVCRTLSPAAVSPTAPRAPSFQACPTISARP